MPTEEEIVAAKTAADEAAAKAAADEASELGLGDKGKAAIAALRKEKKDAADRAAAFATELETLRKEKADAAAAKATSDEAEAAKRGEFEQLATKHKTEADAAKAEAKAAADELKAIWDDRMKRMDAGIKDFPKEIPDWKYYPGDDASPKDRWAWFEKASESASEEKKVTDARARPRNPMTPIGVGDLNGLTDETARKSQERHLANTF